VGIGLFLNASIQFFGINDYAARGIDNANTRKIF
jgi:hypothetical protein